MALYPDMEAMALYPNKSILKKFWELIDTSKIEFTKSGKRKYASYKMVNEWVQRMRVY